MDNIVAFINEVGATCKGSIGTVLTLNFVVGETVVSLGKWLCQAILALLIGAAQVLKILLEDFGVFLEEISETLLMALGGLFNGIDCFFNVLTQGANDFYLAILNGCRLLNQFFMASAKAVFEASDWLGKTLYFGASTLVLAVSLIPQMLTSSLWGVYLGFRGCLLILGDAATHSFKAVREAPLQAVLGFITASVFTYLSYRTAKRLIVDRQITARHMVHWTFKALCFLYVLFINLNLFIIRAAVGIVEFILSHLHVARFHHGPMDSDEEGEADPEVIPADNLDDSDTEGDARAEARRRTYNLLVKRRDERHRKRGRSRPKMNNEEDVEDLLLEQVEREREDKLCVICQDREKCIMILPCRHLCICQDCQVTLMQRTDQAHSRTCPICRKNVKQTIKAYL